jgi:hypothetical protein
MTKAGRTNSYLFTPVTHGIDSPDRRASVSCLRPRSICRARSQFAVQAPDTDPNTNNEVSEGMNRIQRNTGPATETAFAPIDARSSLPLVLALLVGAAFVAIAANARATLYKWMDDRGVVHYSDQLPADAVNRANFELNRDGLTVKKTVQARPVVQQIPKTESDEQRLRQAERDRMIASRRDRALIESYANEAEIDLAKSRAIATIDSQVQSAEGFIAQMTKRREELESKKAGFAPRPVPGAIERELETTASELGRQNELVTGKKKESASVAARYDADKQRFRELHSASPSGSLVTSSDGRYSAAEPLGIKLTSTR